ncbi:MAG: LacI family DNA-binding transcriptional regulator [Mesorhizobium sp.]|uniref:LacI family DNA-binding transcriptional regulator n=1 Tax=unclassified Mesorhizobium TaxID=325217 RepID=UPI000FCCD8D8|nr:MULTISPECIES: LacI family DNA-binding transcriptional regulator [unclassified Mesorhizobium]RUV68824.1 LacI family DNA-binding transcriptional regulator [Mesorhizobium sp. M5C.F.Cr.IN.023.01.1.1]RWI53860.1 MAG: LacI family DNA-binding transcriptional regulator [Mesorhizobium sp.]RWI59451.1 MAG: LacI family DNA-binding transcriptional regulator [Mesorhizobium sp.]RWJ05442.1 MAG: LacI family DNA-binding transcriptional regulator [Mesorhizobium sp.]RWJ15391.1 MAG: LacI family DNA-binding trans
MQSEAEQGTQTGAMITLTDVARAAGVGESTASRVLRGHGSFSPKTRESVLTAARSLGYVPNRIAGTLASMGSKLVGVVIPSLSNIVFPDVLRGANTVLVSAGFQPVVAVTDYDLEREESVIESLLSWRPAGMMVAGLEHTERTGAMLRNARIRVAELLDTDGEGIDIVVGFSNRKAGRASAQHLVSRGYRCIGYVGHDLSLDLRAAKRFASFRAALGEAGLSVIGEEIIPAASSIEAGRDGLARLLERCPDLDAVYFSNDDMAIGGYFHCLAHGITIPDRLAIFGYNGLDVARSAPQPLSTILTPRVTVGEIGARLVCSDGPSAVVDIGFELIEGATT